MWQINALGEGTGDRDYEHFLCSHIYPHCLQVLRLLQEQRRGATGQFTLRCQALPRGFHFLSLRESKGTKIHSENNEEGSWTEPQEQGLSTRGDRVPVSSCPKQHLATCEDIFVTSEGCNWHRVGRGQGCCRTVPTTKHYPPPNFNTAEIRNWIRALLIADFFWMLKSERNMGTKWICIIF